MQTRSDEIQNLADQIADLTKEATAGGVELSFHLRIEVGDGHPVPADTLEKLNKVLQQVSNRLAVRNP